MGWSRELPAFGRWLRRARRAAGYPNIFAWSKALDYHAPHLAEMERGENIHPAWLLERMAPLLGVSRVEIYLRAGLLPPELCGEQPDGAGLTDDQVAQICAILAPVAAVEGTDQPGVTRSRG